VADERLDLAQTPQGFAGDGACEAGIARLQMTQLLKRAVQCSVLAQNVGKYDLGGGTRRNAITHVQGPVCAALCATIARRRAMRSAVEG